MVSHIIYLVGRHCSQNVLWVFMFWKLTNMFSIFCIILDALHYIQMQLLYYCSTRVIQKTQVSGTVKLSMVYHVHCDRLQLCVTNK